MKHHPSRQHDDKHAMLRMEPSTEAKQNITQRRSRGRREEPSGRQPEDLTAKRPHERAKDKAYARQSGDWKSLSFARHKEDSSGPTPQRPVHERQTPLPNSTLSFLKRDIPPYEDYPDTNVKLMELFHNREGYGEELREAIQDKNSYLIERMQRFVHECNSQMHEVYLQHLQDIEEYHSASSSPASSDDGKTVLNNAAHISHAISQKQFSRSTCPKNQIVFRIWFNYLDHEAEMEVWDSMSLSNLFRFAYAWMVRDFDLEISAESVNLKLLPYTVLAREGYLFEVPVLPEDRIEIEFGFFDSQIRRPTNERRDPPPRTVSLGSTPSDGIRSTGLDAISYDRIRQTFKCPKFSGKTKDWKLWDKGLHRYLSIWELIHVLDPEFFSQVPLSKEHIRDNKLVYYIIEDSV